MGLSQDPKGQSALLGSEIGPRGFSAGDSLFLSLNLCAAGVSLTHIRNRCTSVIQSSWHCSIHLEEFSCQLLVVMAGPQQK